MGQVFRSADCQKEVDEMEILKSKNVQKLAKGKRSKLKGAKELSSRFLARVLRTMMQRYSDEETKEAQAAPDSDDKKLHNNMKVLAQNVLKMYFTNETISFPADETINFDVVLTDKYNPKPLTEKDKKDTEKTVEAVTTEDTDDINVSPDKGDEEEVTTLYANFRNIVGTDNTLSREEFAFLNSIDSTEKSMYYGGDENIFSLLLFIVFFFLEIGVFITIITPYNITLYLRGYKILKYQNISLTLR